MQLIIVQLQLIIVQLIIVQLQLQLIIAARSWASTPTFCAIAAYHRGEPLGERCELGGAF